MPRRISRVACATLLSFVVGAVGASAAFAGDARSAHAEEIAAAQRADQQRLVRRAQQALHEGGYDPGEVDGLMGPRTRAAISAFQRDQGLETTGELGPKTLDALLPTR